MCGSCIAISGNLGSYTMCERAATSVSATLCKRCGVLCHNSDHDSYIGIAAATAPV